MTRPREAKGTVTKSGDETDETSTSSHTRKRKSDGGRGKEQDKKKRKTAHDHVTLENAWKIQSKSLPVPRIVREEPCFTVRFQKKIICFELG